MGFVRALASLVILLLAGPVSAETANNKVALVIGNSTYRQSSLASPAKDARLMAETLKAAGFEVFDFYDVGQRKMKQALLDFADTVRERGKDAVAFVYYAGYGVQVNGQNYLVPVDEQIESEAGVEIDAVSLATMMNVLQNTETRAFIVVLDACRVNPFGFARGAGGGLAKVEAPGGSLIAFSASPGTVAPEVPAGDNSPYTAALARAIAERGLKFEEVFKKVRTAVGEKTRGGQTPWESASLTGDLYPAGVR